MGCHWTKTELPLAEGKGGGSLCYYLPLRKRLHWPVKGAYIKHRCREHWGNDAIDITLFYFVLLSPAHVGSFVNISIHGLWNFKNFHFSDIDRMILTIKLPMVFKWAIWLFICLMVMQFADFYPNRRSQNRKVNRRLNKYRPICLKTMRLLLY